MADLDQPDYIDEPEGAYESPEGLAEPAAQSAEPFVRAPKTRVTQPPINDDALAAEDAAYTHDSGFTNDGSSLSGKGYRKSRSDMNVLRRDLQYGQYLSIPKGRRDIFVSRERKTRVRTVIAVFLLLALLAVAAYFVVIYLKSQFG